MLKLSTGQDSILKHWIELSSAFFGTDSAPTKFLKKKAEESPNGIYEEVISDERQLLLVLANMFLKEMEELEEESKDEQKRVL